MGIAVLAIQTDIHTTFQTVWAVVGESRLRQGRRSWNWRPIAYRKFASVETLSNLHSAIQNAFNQFGVQIMSPHFMVQPNAAVVPRERWGARPSKPLLDSRDRGDRADLKK